VCPFQNTLIRLGRQANFGCAHDIMPKKPKIARSSQEDILIE